MTQADVVWRKSSDYIFMYLASQIGDFPSIIALHSNIEPCFEAFYSKHIQQLILLI